MATAIKWRDADRKKLANYVRKFNAAITREGKKNPHLLDAGLLPEKLNTKSLEKSIYSRADFNVVLSRIDRFFKPGARDIVTLSNGIKITKWQKREIQYAAQRQKQQKRAAMKKAGISGAAQAEVEQNYADLSKRMKEILGRKKNFNSVSTYDPENENQIWNNFVKKVFAQSTDEYQNRMNKAYLENSLKAFESQFSEEHSEQLKTLLKERKIDGELLYIMAGRNPNINFEVYYSEESEEDRYELVRDSIINEYLAMIMETTPKEEKKKPKRRKKK